MLPTLADVAAVIDRAPPDRRASLDELAVALLRLGSLRRQVAQMRAIRRRALDSHTPGGDDDGRDAAAA